MDENSVLEFGASELRLERFCLEATKSLKTKRGIAVKRERARQSLHAQVKRQDKKIILSFICCFLNLLGVQLQMFLELSPFRHTCSAKAH